MLYLPKQLSRGLWAAAVGLLLATVSLLSEEALGQPVPPPLEQLQRKNIDDLSPEEFENYKHAVDVLKKRDDDPQYKTSSYNYFANLHNVHEAGKSGCEHRSELFFPWHRQLLYQFEKALQESDPPRTSKVTVPYWDWTKTPTGKRYPKAFEDEKSVLYHKDRVDTAAPSPMYEFQKIEQEIRSARTWNEFAGTGTKPRPDGDGPPAPPAPGFFEHRYHNPMHNWMGEPMNSEDTAAEDPIFWSFHSFVDLIWWRWQEQWPDQTCVRSDETGKTSLDAQCLERPLLGLNGKLKDTIDIRALGYGYLFEEKPKQPLAVALKTAAAPRAQAQLKATRPTDVVPPFIFDVTIPEEGFATAHIRIADVRNPTTRSYGADTFLYPASVALDPKDPSFRKKYGVNMFALWKSKHAHEGHANKISELFINATTELSYLAKTQPGAAWKIALVVREPEAVDRKEAMAPGAKLLSEEVAFGEVSIVLDHFGFTRGR